MGLQTHERNLKMTIEEKIKDLIISRYKSLRAFVQTTDLSYSTVDSILRRGVANSSLTNVLKLCDALEISADELANNKIIPKGKNIQHRSHMTEINDIISFTKRNIQEYDNLTIDGNPMTKNEIEMLMDALDIGIGIINRNRERNQ